MSSYKQDAKDKYEEERHAHYSRSARKEGTRGLPTVYLAGSVLMVEFCLRIENGSPLVGLTLFMCQRATIVTAN